jgi:hypothetical protein
MIMNWLGKMFKKKKKGYNTDSQYKLLIIDDESELLHRNLGISDERVRELLASCVNAYETSKSMHKALEKVVIMCKHTNEVVMASLMLQKVVDKHQSHERMHDMLKNLFDRG